MEQSPEIVEFIEEVAGIYFRSILLPEAGLRVPQHVHPYDHAMYCGSGAAIMFVDGKRVQLVEAGHAVEIKADHKHGFESVEPNTRLTCVHDTRSAAIAKEI